MPRGLRHIALSISFLSPIVRAPDAFLATKIASLIFLPERWFLDFTSFQSRTRPSLILGSSLFDLPAEAIFLALAGTFPAAREHPQPAALASHQKDFAALYRYQL
jgi:hypothetical protein